MPKGVAELYTYDPTIADKLSGGRKDKHEVWINDRPFGSGGCRQAFMCQISGTNRRFVAKKYLRDEGFVEDYISTQMAATCAHAYNQLNPPKKINYILANRILALNDEDYCIEEFLDGHWQKHNDIFGNILSQKRTPDTFSHFTWEYSRQRYVILDVQGVGETFTDPAVVSIEARRFGYTDTGLKGIRDFFANHRCNEICKALGLKEVRNIPDTLTWFEDPEKPLACFESHNNQVPHKVKREQAKAAAAAKVAAEKAKKEARENPPAANKSTPTVDVLANWMDLGVFELKKLLTQANRPFDTTGVEKRDLVIELASVYYPLYRISDNMWREVDERRRSKAAAAATSSPITPTPVTPSQTPPESPVPSSTPPPVVSAAARPASSGPAQNKPKVVSAAAMARPQPIQPAKAGPASPAVPPPAAPYYSSGQTSYVQGVTQYQKQGGLGVTGYGQQQPQSPGAVYGQAMPNLPPRPLDYEEGGSPSADSGDKVVNQNSPSEPYARASQNTGVYFDNQQQQPHRSSAYTSTPPRAPQTNNQKQPSPPNFLAPRPSPTAAPMTPPGISGGPYYPLSSTNTPPPPLVPHGLQHPWGATWR